MKCLGHVLSRSLALSSLLSAACVLSACGPPVTALTVFRHPEAGGIKRAAYELECPEDQLQFTDLGGKTYGSYGAVGVSGCGKRAVYKHVANAGWVNNTGADDAKAEGAKK